MRIPTFRFPGNVTLYNLGDVHRGDRNCNVDLWRRIVKAIQEDETAYWVSTGDLLNVALKTSLSDCSKSMSLEEEFNALCGELEPTKGRCLGIVGSNHHHRVQKAIGMDLDGIISRELDIPYYGPLGVLNIICDRCSYVTILHHGVGGGKKRGGAVNNLDELGDVIGGADLYLEGHTHKFTTHQNLVPYLDRKRNILNYHTAHFVTTGHFLNWEKSYAQDFKLRPQPQGAAKMNLYASECGRSEIKKISVELFN